MKQFYIVFLLNGLVINIEPYADKDVRDQAMPDALVAGAAIGAEVQSVDME